MFRLAEPSLGSCRRREGAISFQLIQVKNNLKKVFYAPGLRATGERFSVYLLKFAENRFSGLHPIPVFAGELGCGMP